jgi:hypothetical protein
MKRIRDAQTIVGMLEGGKLAQDMSTELVDTLKWLKELSDERPKTKIKGSVSLKIGFEVEGGQVIVAAEIDSKRPKAPRSSNFYWLTDDGELSTEHPQQQDMFAGPREARA